MFGSAGYLSFPVDPEAKLGGFGGVMCWVEELEWWVYGKEKEHSELTHICS